jgi:sugar phosphate permease
MSALGFGGFAGQIILPGVSDFLGRRTMAVLGFVGAAISVYIFARIGPNPAFLFAVLFIAAAMALGSLALLTGPIAAESAPAGMVSSAAGIVVGIGEIFGGGIAPAFAGYIAQHYGIQHTLDLALGGLVTGIVVCLFLKETAPRKSRAATAGEPAIAFIG